MASNKSGGTMSSRLLTMKFMQRAAASPGSSPGGTPDQRSAKRRRLSNGSFQSPVSTPGSDAEAIQQALAAEEQKRQEAVDREAAKRGETKWILDVKTPSKAVETAPLRVISAGYSTIDLDIEDQDEDVLESLTPGRKSFGVIAKPKPAEANSDADSDEQQSPNNAPVEGVRANKAGKRDRSTSTHRGVDKRSKQFELNKLTSISNAGSGRGMSNMTCHKCGKTGHIKAQCPQGRR